MDLVATILRNPVELIRADRGARVEIANDNVEGPLRTAERESPRPAWPQNAPDDFGEAPEENVLGDNADPGVPRTRPRRPPSSRTRRGRPYLVFTRSAVRLVDHEQIAAVQQGGGVTGLGQMPVVPYRKEGVGVPDADGQVAPVLADTVLRGSWGRRNRASRREHPSRAQSPEGTEQTLPAVNADGHVLHLLRERMRGTGGEELVLVEGERREARA